MTFGFDRFKNCADPKNILEIIPKELVVPLMKGFFLDQHAGVMLIYDQDGSMEDMWGLSPLRGEDPFLFQETGSISQADATFAEFRNPFCQKFRERETQIELCRISDTERAQRVLRGDCPGVTMQKCHMGLTEWTCPVIIGNRPRAVLLAGQRIVGASEADLAYILRQVEKKGDSEDQAELKRLAVQHMVTSERAEEFRRKFVLLCDVVQKTVDALYHEKWESAVSVIINNIQDSLSQRISATSAEQWWHVLADVIEAFEQATGVEGLYVYTRRYYHYEQAVSVASGGADVRRLPVGNVVEKVLQDQLVKVSNEMLGLEETEGLAGLGYGWAYRTEQRGLRINVSTLLVINGEIPEIYESFVEEFCRAVAGHVDMASMMSQMQEARQSYELRVGTIGHSFRTPLQSLLLSIRSLLKKVSDKRLRKRLERMDKRVIDARADVTILLREATDEHGDVDMVVLLKEVLKDLEPQANKKRCRFVRPWAWPAGAVVQGSKYRLRRALSNLLDNAIKYSWSDHGIKINMTANQKTVTIILNNYGLGIRAEKMDEISRYGIRGLAPDKKRPIRRGTGWGLPIAIDTVEQHGGWLEITSKAGDDSLRIRGEELHRYVTEVQVHLPLKGKT